MLRLRSPCERKPSFASVEIAAPIGLAAAWSFVLKTGFFLSIYDLISGLHGWASSIAIVSIPLGKSTTIVSLPLTFVDSIPP